MVREGVLSILPVWLLKWVLRHLKLLVPTQSESLLTIDTASKGAVLAMSRELAIVHAKDGIRVNALCPGPLNTPLLQNFLDTPEKRYRRTIHLPTGRFGTELINLSADFTGEAIEQAHAAVFLASDESSYITATVLTLMCLPLTYRISW